MCENNKCMMCHGPCTPTYSTISYSNLVHCSCQRHEQSLPPSLRDLVKEEGMDSDLVDDIRGRVVENTKQSVKEGGNGYSYAQNIHRVLRGSDEPHPQGIIYTYSEFLKQTGLPADDLPVG